VGHDDKNSSAVAHDVRSPNVVPHDNRVLALWGLAAASPLYKGATAAAAGPSLTPSLPHSSKSMTFNPSEHFWLRYVSKFSLV
jgi:hypothetical protein